MARWVTAVVWAQFPAWEFVYARAQQPPTPGLKKTEKTYYSHLDSEREDIQCFLKVGNTKTYRENWSAIPLPINNHFEAVLFCP